LGEDEDKERGMSDEVIEKKVNEIMSHISSELSHDLRGHLQTIQNAVYLIRRRPDDEELYRIVDESLRKVIDMLDAFRDFYKAQILHRVEFNPVDVVSMALADLDIPDNITLVKELPQLEPVNVDPVKLSQALRHLIVNALEAMPEGGTLTIRVSEDRGGVTYTVEDTGPGIPPDVVEVLFTPFMGVKKKGYGLGVTTAKRVAESHGGSLSFETVPGVGTVFKIYIPRLR